VANIEDLLLYFLQEQEGWQEGIRIQRRYVERSRHCHLMFSADFGYDVTDEAVPGLEDMEIDEVEPNPMPARRKSVGGGSGLKKAQPATPTTTSARRSKRRQAEPEPQVDSNEDSLDEDEDDYEDEDDDDVPFSAQEKAKATKTTDAEGSSANAMASLFGSLPRSGEVSTAELERIQALMNTLTGAGAGGFFGSGGRASGGRSETWTTMLKDLKSPKPASRYSALQEATTTIALAQEDQFHYFPWEDAVKVFLGLMSGKPIIDGKAEETTKAKVADVEDVEDDFDSMTEEQQMMYAMALSSGGKMPSADAELDPEQDQQAQLLACRCLQNLMMASEGHGMTAGYIVRNGGVKVLCDKLTSIENIELAEQVIVVSIYRFLRRCG
jgi:hypothetical protein